TPSGSLVGEPLTPTPPEGRGREGTARARGSPLPIPPLPCGRAEQRSGVGIRNSHVRRPRSGQVCEFPPRREQRKEARRAPDFGSPFFWARFFGEAKKSASAAGPRPGQTKIPEKKDLGWHSPLTPACLPQARERSPLVNTPTPK